MTQRLQFTDDWLREDAELKRKFRENGRSFKARRVPDRRQMQPLLRFLFWGQLTADLEAGGNATARRLEWPTPSDTDYAVAEEEAEFTVYDDFWKSLTADSGAKIIYLKDHGRRVVLMTVDSSASQRPWIYGTLQADLTFEGSTTINTGQTVHDLLLTTGYKLSSGTKVKADWHTEDEKYYVTAADTCAVEDA